MKYFKLTALLLALALLLSACALAKPVDDDVRPVEAESTVPELDPPTEPPETEPAETEPAETGPAETEPVQTGPTETEPAETEPPETEPIETEPPETEPIETEPAETEPVETEPVETEPAETEPIETEPAETEPPEPPEVVMPEPEQPRTAADYGQVLRLLAGQDDELRWRFEEWEIEAGEDPDALSDPGAGNEGIEDADLDVPVPGVARGGKVCAAGDVVYMLNSYGLVSLAARGTDSRILAETYVPHSSDDGSGVNEALFVWKDRAAVVYTVSGYGVGETGWYDTNRTHAAVFDCSDPAAPRLMADVGLDGRCFAVRAVGGTLYLITNHYLWSVEENADPAAVIPGVYTGTGKELLAPERIWLCGSPNSAAFTVVGAISLETGDLTDALAFTDAAESLYVDSEGLLLARTVWTCGESEPYSEGFYTVTDYRTRTLTEIKGLRADGAGGLELACTGWVEGELVNQTAMDRQDGCVRAVTAVKALTCSHYTDESRGWSHDDFARLPSGSRLTVLNAGLEPCGLLEDLGARLSGCRLLGRTGFLPGRDGAGSARLLDLSAPADPKMAGALELAGDYEYLLPFTQGLVLGFSGDDPNQQICLSLYDVKDPARPGLLARSATERNAASAAVRNSGSLLIAPDEGLLGFPETLEEGTCFHLLRFDGAELTELRSYTLSFLPEDAGAVLLDGLLYLCSPGMTYVIDPASDTPAAIVTNAEG